MASSTQRECAILRLDRRTTERGPATRKLRDFPPYPTDLQHGGTFPYERGIQMNDALRRARNRDRNFLLPFFIEKLRKALLNKDLAPGDFAISGIDQGAHNGFPFFFSWWLSSGKLRFVSRRTAGTKQGTATNSFSQPKLSGRFGVGDIVIVIEVSRPKGKCN